MRSEIIERVEMIVATDCRLIIAHEAAVPLNISAENGADLSLAILFIHRNSPFLKNRKDVNHPKAFRHLQEAHEHGKVMLSIVQNDME
jgi:hypothetical protein